MAGVIRIKDTGLDVVGGTETHAKVTYGVDNWVPLNGFSLTGEFTVKGTNNEASRTSGNYFAGTALTYNPNEIAAIIPPRFTIRGLVNAEDSTLVRAIVNLQRTLGIKRLTGGIGLIDALPEVATDTYEYVSILIKNVTFTERIQNDKKYIDITINAEQVN